MLQDAIDQFLQKTLTLSEELRNRGELEKSIKILRSGSVIAEFGMKIAKMKPYKVLCPNCKRHLKTGLEIEFMRHIGECARCDHLRTDALDPPPEQMEQIMKESETL